jgi:molecular chaperone GrpE
MNSNEGNISPENELENNNSENLGEQTETAQQEPVVTEESEIEKLKAQLAESNDKFIRLYSEFDNYRKRTAKEKIDLSKTAGEDVFKAILPVIDDFERGIKAMDTAQDIVALKEGVDLIYNKMKNILIQKGLEPMETNGTIFNSDIHEAITNIPAPTEDLKGKIVDELEKGYLLNGKVIRFAKVVVGN